MNTKIILYIILLILGILINIFMGKLVKIIFKKDGTLPRLPLRILGIYLIINSISNIFHI
ncbi:MAG: hypothetical protein Q8900_10470 [Bacillota bacterium]|nr:hypothetical protein [Bacillota bacterium]